MTDWRKKLDENTQDYTDRQMEKWRASEKAIAQAEKDRNDPRLIVPSDERIRASHGAQDPTKTIEEAGGKGKAKTEREQKMDAIMNQKREKPSEAVARDDQDRKSRGR